MTNSERERHDAELTELRDVAIAETNRANKAEAEVERLRLQNEEGVKMVRALTDELMAAATRAEQWERIAQAAQAQILRVVAANIANTPRKTVPLAAVIETLFEVADRIEAGDHLAAAPVQDAAPEGGEG